jgi:hypothetical protein
MHRLPRITSVTPTFLQQESCYGHRRRSLVRKTMGAERPRRAAGPIAVVFAIAALAGCGAGSAKTPPIISQATALQRYLAQVEPIRLAVNRLLARADPILTGYSRHKLDAHEAERQMNSLEGRFAAYTVKINGLRAVPPELAAAQRAYAHTYILEDAYLSALVAAIPDHSFDDLPRTQDAQRAAIIAWRTRLQVVADRLGLRLPPDIQVAGRGEIAPSPLGS